MIFYTKRYNFNSFSICCFRPFVMIVVPPASEPRIVLRSLYCKPHFLTGIKRRNIITDTKLCITAFTNQISPYHFLLKGFAIMLLCMDGRNAASPPALYFAIHLRTLVFPTPYFSAISRKDNAFCKYSWTALSFYFCDNDDAKGFL